MSFQARLEAAGWDPLSAQYFHQLVNQNPNGTAVFDADGTLWDGDCGEDLFRALFRGGHIETEASEESIVRAYVEHCERNVTEAYGWIVQQMAGVDVSVVTRVAEELMKSFVEKMAFPPMVKLLRELESEGWKCWIVSASAGVVVRSGARALGLDPKRVLGVELGVENGCYTNELVQLPNLEGKVEAIMSAGLSPCLAAGNSVNDIPMLKCSSGSSFCVNPSEELYQEALASNWLCVAMAEGGLR